MTTTPAEDDVELTLDLHQRPREEITTRPLGLAGPYVLLQPRNVTDAGFEVGVEAGGGARLLDVAEFLEAIAEGLKDPSTIQQITAAAEAAEKEEQS